MKHGFNVVPSRIDNLYQCIKKSMINIVIVYCVLCIVYCVFAMQDVLPRVRQVGHLLHRRSEEFKLVDPSWSRCLEGPIQ